MIVNSGIFRSNWTPRDISTALWLDGRDLSTLTLVSGAVSQWNDKSGNARHAAQSTSASRPTYASQAVTFDGGNDFLRISSSFLATFTLVIAAVVKENTGGFGGIITSKSPSLDSSPALNINAARRYEFDLHSANPVTSTSLGSAKSIVVGQALSSTDYLIAINGTVEATSTTGGTFSSTASVTDLGLYRTNEGANSGAFDLNELVVLTSGSTLANRQKLEGYLAHKWNLVSSLPSNHPFKAYPPRGI